MTTQPGVKRRATRRGLRSLDGMFYHKVKERNDADRAFNKATKRLPADIHKGHQGKPGDSFDFTYKQNEIIKPDSTIVAPTYHCNNCKAAVDRGTLQCPSCGGRLNWEGL